VIALVNAASVTGCGRPDNASFSISCAAPADSFDAVRQIASASLLSSSPIRLARCASQPGSSFGPTGHTSTARLPIRSSEPHRAALRESSRSVRSNSSVSGRIGEIRQQRFYGVLSTASPARAYRAPPLREQRHVFACSVTRASGIRFDLHQHAFVESAAARRRDD